MSMFFVVDIYARCKNIPQILKLYNDILFDRTKLFLLLLFFDDLYKTSEFQQLLIQMIKRKIIKKG
jgi:hypothetical protein